MATSLVDRITLEMNLRPPQADSLRKFARLVGTLDLLNASQGDIRRELEMGTLQFPDDYARLTFALATGVGKTRLMGALMAWLFLSGKTRDFVLIAPSSTIYRKLKAEAHPKHPKYIFAGLSQFPQPEIYYAENIETFRPNQPQLTDAPRLFIFSPSQIRPRSGSEAERRMRRENENSGESYLFHLANLPGRVALLDEGHRYGGESWAQAVVDLRPQIAIDMTATPPDDGTVLHRYELKEALRDGLYIKNVVAYVDKRTGTYTDEEWDRHALFEGLRRHDIKFTTLEAYRANHPEVERVKPLTLVVCRDIAHAKKVEQWLQSQDCFKGKYAGKVLRVVNKSPKEDIEKLLEVENPDESTEIIVNVGLLKEGWDVKNVYVIVPLRAMAGETLATQTIGRGLRLPFGQRIGDEEADTLDVLAFGRETVEQVIQAAKAAGLAAGNVRQHQGNERDERVLRTVTPSKELSLAVPAVSLRYTRWPTLKGFSASAHIQLDSEIEPQLKRIDFARERPEEYILDIESTPLMIPNVPKRLGTVLVWKFTELREDKEIPEAERIFREYLEGQGCITRESQRKALAARGAEIFDDVCRQVEAYLNSIVKTEYKIEQDDPEPFVFPEITHSISRDNGIADKEYPDTTQHFLNSHLFSGWNRSLYPNCKFNTAQEVHTARILDRTASIKKWIRNPTTGKGFSVATALGNHFPDFIVLEKDKVTLLEIKNADELANPASEPRKKAEAAKNWCDEASATDKTKWEYVIVPHDRVMNCSTWEDLKNARFVL